jgi:hypothetical protein
LLGAFVGIEADSLPSLPAAGAAAVGEWVALTARQARRGADQPVIAGRGAGGRTVVFALAGLHHWAFRGGQAEQAWRAMVGQAAAWLLAAPATAGASVRAVEPVTERGRPVRFQAMGDRTPVAITLTGADTARSDTLRFDTDGVARIALAPGAWTWATTDGARGVVEVERYAAEIVPRPPTLGAREAEAMPVPARRSLREMLPFFALAVAAFVTEWVVRRRMGLR